MTYSSFAVNQEPTSKFSLFSRIAKNMYIHVYL